VVEVVERWWNGRYGRLARRDLWLKRDAEAWRVEARAGDSDSPTWGRDYPDETTARAMLDQLLARGSDTWRDLSGLRPTTPAGHQSERDRDTDQDEGRHGRSLPR
jgi:hypothetical protein